MYFFIWFRWHWVWAVPHRSHHTVTPVCTVHANMLHIRKIHSERYAPTKLNIMVRIVEYVLLISNAIKSHICIEYRIYHFIRQSHRNTSTLAEITCVRERDWQSLKCGLPIRDITKNTNFSLVNILRSVFLAQLHFYILTITCIRRDKRSILDSKAPPKYLSPRSRSP